jgi:hypothetical protein
MASQFNVLTTFKDSLISFFDELIGQFPQEADLVIARIFLKDQVPIIDVMNHFIHRLLPLKSKIKLRDESVFLDNDILFEKLSKDKVNHFKRLWRSGQLDEDDKETVWRWFESFIFLAERYDKSYA